MPATSGSMLLIIAIVCLTIGYVFGWIVAGFSRSKSEKKEQEPELAETPEAKPVKAVAEPLPVEQPNPATVALMPMLKVWKGAEENELTVEVNHNRLVHSKALLTMDDRKSIEAALRATANWMGLAYQLGEPAPVVSVAPVTPMIPTVTNELPAAPSLVINGMTNVLADALQPQVKRERHKSIVEQIDEVLQAKLLGTPLENERIFLTEDPRRGVIVRVGTQVYEGVGSLPEGDVKNLLRAAVAEWEKQQESASRRTV